jgi:hypothetical protein
MVHGNLCSWYYRRNWPGRTYLKPYFLFFNCQRLFSQMVVRKIPVWMGPAIIRTYHLQVSGKIIATDGAWFIENHWRYMKSWL